MHMTCTTVDLENFHSKNIFVVSLNLENKTQPLPYNTNTDKSQYTLCMTT